MKKNLTQLGRSMVEMLGVLAIIGVLSIVGIAGYQKAMNKIHANELMDLAIKGYNEAYSRNLTNLKASWYAFKTTAMGLWMDRPSWLPSNADIQLRLQPNTETSYSNQSYHMVVFYNMEDCVLCSELKNLTEAPSDSTVKYRLMPSNNMDVPVRFYCCSGTYSTEGCERCWP